MKEKKINGTGIFFIILTFAFIALIVTGIASCSASVYKSLKADEERRMYEDAQRTVRYYEYLDEKDSIENPKTHIIKNPATPYVGMPESMMNDTGLGRYSKRVEGSSFVAGGIHYNYCTYSFWQGDRLLFSAKVLNGVVREVDDYRDRDVRKTNITFTKDDSPDYDDPEELWEEEYEEFEDEEEAEEWFYEEYGDGW